MMARMRLTLCHRLLTCPTELVKVRHPRLYIHVGEEQERTLTKADQTTISPAPPQSLSPRCMSPHRAIRRFQGSVPRVISHRHP